MKAFSENLRRLRESLGLTKTLVAKTIGISLPAYTAYESGREKIGDREPTFENLVKIADFFGVSVDKLLQDHENEFERCKKLWLAGGATIEIIQKPFEWFSLFPDYKEEDYKKEKGEIVRISQKGKEKENGYRSIEFYYKDDFINYTHRIEEEGENIFCNMVKQLGVSA